MGDILIRRAEISDAPAIYEFVCGLEDELFNRDAFNACYKACLEGANHHYLVAIIDERPVGYISCHGQILLHHLGLVYEIQEMYVAPEFRNRGIGKKMLEALEEIIGKEPYQLLEVASNMRRKDAHRFYLDSGFTQTTYKFKKL